MRTIAHNALIGLTRRRLLTGRQLRDEGGTSYRCSVPIQDPSAS